MTCDGPPNARRAIKSSEDMTAAEQRQSKLLTDLHAVDLPQIHSAPTDPYGMRVPVPYVEDEDIAVANALSEPAKGRWVPPVPSESPPAKPVAAVTSEPAVKLATPPNVWDVMLAFCDVAKHALALRAEERREAREMVYMQQQAKEKP